MSHAFQRLRVVAEIVEEPIDAVPHVFDGFARHGCEGVDEEIDGQSA